MTLILILLLILMALFGIGFYQMRRYILFKQRLDKISAPFASNLTEAESLSNQDRFQKSYLLNARRILNYFNVLTVDKTHVFTKRLANAGWLSRNALVVFFSLQFISIFGGLFLGLGLVVLIPWLDSKPWVVKSLVVLFLTWLGYRFPEWYLSRLTQRYRTRLRRSILDFLDLFLICIEAGFSNDKALGRVSVELETLHPELMEQVRILITELSILPNRRLAWENFAERTGIDESKVTAQIINQSEQLGSSISQALRAQIEMFRSERLGFVEQRAMRLPTLLTLPLVLFIFPALMLVILGPAILKAIQVFNK